MRHEEFQGILVDSPIGVAPAGEDTFALARAAAHLEFSSALEIGTGTGFIPIYLTKIGRACEGADLSVRAIDCAHVNAKKNGLNVKFFVSNLFSNAQGRFDLIIFNPPAGYSRDVDSAARVELIKSLVKKIWPQRLRFLSRLLTRKMAYRRKEMFDVFFEQARRFLEPHGRFLLLIHEEEMALFDGFLVDTVGGFKDVRVITVSFP